MPKNSIFRCLAKNKQNPDSVYGVVIVNAISDTDAVSKANKYLQEKLNNNNNIIVKIGDVVEHYDKNCVFYSFDEFVAFPILKGYEIVVFASGGRYTRIHEN